VASGTHSDFLWIYPERYNPFFTLTDTVSLDPNPLAPPADVALAALARESSLKGRVLSEIVYKLLHRSLLNSP
jgi:hypothetical protein